MTKANQKTKLQNRRSFISQPVIPERLPAGIFTLKRLLKVMRLSRGYTQKQMADRLGTKRQHVQKWEYGKVKPRPERLAQILELFRYEGLTEVIYKFYH